MDLGLSGKKAVIVGGARGIGYAVAETLAREGADVAITARGEDAVKDAVANLRKYGTNVVGSPVNVQRAEEYKEWLARVDEEIGGADILVPITSAGGDRQLEVLASAFEVGRHGPAPPVEALLHGMVEAARARSCSSHTPRSSDAAAAVQRIDSLYWGKHSRSRWQGISGSTLFRPADRV